MILNNLITVVKDSGPGSAAGRRGIESPAPTPHCQPYAPPHPHHPHPPREGAREPVGGRGAGPPAAARSSRNSTVGLFRTRRQARSASATAATAATATQALRFVIATDLCAACLPALRPCRRARRVPDFSIRLCTFSLLPCQTSFPEPGRFNGPSRWLLWMPFGGF